MDKLKRGAIVEVDNPLKTAHGHVICKNRPATIVQNDVGNTYSDTLIVAYLTGGSKRPELPTHVVLQWYKGLKSVSTLCTEQLATIDKTDVLQVLDYLRDEDVVRMDKALATSIGLEVNG